MADRSIWLALAAHSDLVEDISRYAAVTEGQG